MSSIGEDQVDLAQTYTGLDKKISEEFISIAMDPERKSKASSSHGSEIGTAKTSWKHGIYIVKHLYRIYEIFSYIFTRVISAKKENEGKESCLIIDALKIIVLLQLYASRFKDSPPRL